MVVASARFGLREAGIISRLDHFVSIPRRWSRTIVAAFVIGYVLGCRTRFTFLTAGSVALRCDDERRSLLYIIEITPWRRQLCMTLRLTAGKSRPIAHLLSRGFNFAASAR
jgi:hypothetical protein